MKSSERFLAALTGADMDRIPAYEIYFWPKTVERWHLEGLPEDVAPQDFFGLDKAGFLLTTGH
jgi:hypothetical protein